MFLTEDGLVKLCDYGLQIADNSNVKITVLHYAPEVFEGRRELKSDVWAFGITLFELAEGENPYENVIRNEIKAVICDKEPPSLSSEKWSTDFVDFVSKCLVKDVNERWSVSALMDVGLVVKHDE